MSKKEKHTVKSINAKSISMIKVIYLVIFLLIGGMVILFSSGTFASLPNVSPSAGNTGVTQQPSNQDPHSGADLNALQKIKELEQSLAANYNAAGLLDLGHLYNDSGFYQKAIDTYKKYLVEVPNTPDVIVDMGVCYYNLQNYDEAIKVMSSALKINPIHQIAKFNLGIVNFSSGDIVKAKQWWQETIQINPNSDIAKKAKSLIESH